MSALDKFVAAVGLSGKQFAVIVHGYVLGQYGLLWALENDGGWLVAHPASLPVPGMWVLSWTCIQSGPAAGFLTALLLPGEIVRASWRLCRCCAALLQTMWRSWSFSTRPWD